MVVVLIIGILVAIAIPVLNAAARAARGRTCHSNQRLLEGAAQQYLDADPVRAMSDITGVNGGLLNSDASPLFPEYIVHPPTCPSNDLFYTMDASGTAGCPDSVALHGRYTGP
jgi:type II secretory pathway pseudopilin PulG